MPFTPADIPWWGWMIITVISAATSFGGKQLVKDASSDSEGFIGLGLVFGFGIVGFLSLFVGLVRLAKWAWAG